MDALTDFFRWFSGGSVQYHTLYQCMMGDKFWIGVTVTLDLAVAAGYVLIALHWWRNQAVLPPTPAKKALGTMRNIFAFCGICGYLFIPIKMFWPAWRLYDLVLLGLVYYTWRYALSTRQLKVIYSELGRSNKLAEDLEKTREESKRKSSFLNALSHDIRTPLNGLVLHADLLQMSLDSNDTESVKSALIAIKQSTRSTSELLDSLLDYARLESAGVDGNRVTRVELNDLLIDVSRIHHQAASRKNLAFKISCPHDLVVQTDSLKLKRILTNLLENAVRYTDAGGIRVEVQSADEGAEIHVIDSGSGIAPEHQSRLFEEFFQVHNHERDRSKGFGLGLAIARRLAVQLGGDVSVDSAPGRGSRFSIVLPNAVVPQNSADLVTA